MSHRRQRQIGELLHEEISRLIQFESKDPRLVMVTVTGVDVTPDYREARVYVAIHGDDAAFKEALAGLVSATGYFRKRLREELSLRFIPELTFKRDTSLEQGQRIDELLDTLKAEGGLGEDNSENQADEA